MRLVAPRKFAGAGSRALIALYCDFCGEIFEVSKNDVLSKVKKRGMNCKRYCSHRCSDTANRLPVRECRKCGKPTKREFCSHSCSAAFNNQTRTRKDAKIHRRCEQCREEHTNPRFCSGRCHQAFREEKFLAEWKKGKESGMTPTGVVCGPVRRYIFKKYGSKCAQCGWCEINPATGKVPVQIEHIDGDFRNCRESNLISLCPNCHSLTPTYMTLNRGRGRDVNGFRRKKLLR